MIKGSNIIIACGHVLLKYDVTSTRLQYCIELLYSGSDLVIYIV